MGPLESLGNKTKLYGFLFLLLMEKINWNFPKCIECTSINGL
jgi:hypothetical protein